jgi:hypothetical protein
MSAYHTVDRPISRTARRPGHAVRVFCYLAAIESKVTNLRHLFCLRQEGCGYGRGGAVLSIRGRLAITIQFQRVAIILCHSLIHFKPEEPTMAEKNQQQDTASTSGTPGSLLNECGDVQMSTNGSDLIISASGANSLTAEVAVTGTNCQSAFVCVWDGQRWICS